MKKFLMILLALSISMSLAADVLKGRINYISCKLPGQEWLGDSSASILITIDNYRITIYSPVTQQFDIAKGIENPLNIIDGVLTSSSWNAIDRKGKLCKIQLVVFEEGLQLYVVYTDISFCYQFQTLD